MTNRYRRFTRTFVAILVAGLACIMALNYVVDPYDIFHSKFFPIEVADNQRFAKIEFLDAHHGEFDTYILGSSRSGVLHPSSLTRWIPDARPYNLSTPGASPAEHLLHVRYLLARQYTIRRLLIQLDLDYLRERSPDGDFGRSLHPHVEGAGLLQGYWTYLTIFPTDTLKIKLRRNRDGLPRPVPLILQTGIIEFQAAEQAIAAQNDAYFTDAAFGIKRANRAPYRSIAQQMGAVRALKEICRARAIACTFFITPHHRHIMDTVNVRAALETLQQLGEITDYYDFSGYNAVTMDNHNYYEPSHYRPFIGERILERLFAPQPSSDSRQWGTYVTSANLVEHVEQSRRNFDNPSASVR